MDHVRETLYARSRGSDASGTASVFGTAAETQVGSGERHHDLLERFMSALWQRSQPIVFRSTSTSTAPDTRFPRAVSGEAYDRFARAMWPQAQRWIRKHSYRFAGVDLTVDDARDVLHSAASIDLARPLYAQEERLLSELLHTEWAHLTRSADIVPEIPTFLLTRR